jgi:hypothetical protein
VNLTLFSPKRRRKTPLITAMTQIAPPDAWSKSVLFFENLKFYA